MKKTALVLLGGLIVILAAQLPASAINYPFESSLATTAKQTPDTIYQRYWTADDPKVNPNCTAVCGTGGASCETFDGLKYCKLAWNSKNNGYRGYGENVANFNGNLPSGTLFNSLFEFETGTGLGSHAGYYSWVQGGIVDQGTDSWFEANCTGTVLTSCPGNGNPSNARDASGVPGVTNNTLGKIGGLSAMPVPRASGYTGGNFNLNWDAVVSVGKNANIAVAGYYLYYEKNLPSGGTCPAAGVPSNAVGGATPRLYTTSSASVPFGDVGMSSATDPACVTFALKVVFPSTSDGTKIVSRFLSHNGQTFGIGAAVRVRDLAANYMGRNNVNVSWKTELEDGLQAFNVYRSFTGTDGWTKVGTVGAKGQPSSYSFIDTIDQATANVRTTGVFYRLDAIDMDNGADSYGPVKAALPSGTSPTPQIQKRTPVR